MSESTVAEVLALEVSGDYGHFRKNYTTSSPLTHGVPPRTALTGLLGAIMGYPPQGDGNYHRVFAPTRAKIAVVPRNPIRKQRINKNMLKVKDETAKLIRLDHPPSEITRNQVPFEMLREPRFTIYVWHEDDQRMDALEDQFASHKAVYTPYLGISELIAEFEFEGRHEVDAKEVDGPVDGVVNSDQYDVTFEQGKQYQRENVSLVMDEDRVVQSFGNVMYAQYRQDSSSETEQEQGMPAPVEVQNGQHYVVGGTGDRITFLTG